ncbi:MAG: UV DNA damage repair endonuclease UvsE [Anaerolineae bacterium]
MQLGFSIRILGASGLPSYDPRLRGDLPANMVCLRDIFHYLHRKRCSMYRMHPALAPQPTQSATIGEQLAEASHEVALCGELARSWDIRLSFHPYSDVILSSPNEELAERSHSTLEGQAALLDAMGLGPEAVIVLHVGGVYDGLEASLERFVRRVEALPRGVRARLALENDDHRYSLAQVKRAHERCGIPLVLDVLHHQVHNPEALPLQEALAYALGTWPPGVVPKIHYATPRSELKTLSDGRLKLPTWTEHADFVNPFVFARFMRESQHVGIFDIMLEAKARDVALFKLRDDLERYAPDVAEWLR